VWWVCCNEGDFRKSVTSRPCARLDTDCNAGTVGCLLGLRNGLDGIPADWKDPLNDLYELQVTGLPRQWKIVELAGEMAETGLALVSAYRAPAQRTPPVTPLSSGTGQVSKMETLAVGEFSVDLCRREDGVFGLGEIRRGTRPLRRADSLITWQVDGRFPVFQRRSGLTVYLQQPEATLTFTPESRPCAGTTFTGFRMELNAARGPVVETASWELGGSTKGLSYFDGYRGWHAPPQWLAADTVPQTNPKLLPSLLQGAGFQFEHGAAGALLHFHTTLGDRLRNVSRGETLEFETAFHGPANVTCYLFTAEGDSRVDLWSRAFEVVHAGCACSACPSPS
jgi:hypothetical protein